MNENEILSKCQKGDKTAFPLLFSLHRRLIESAVFRIVKDREAGKDVIQEVLLRIYKNIHTFNGSCKVSTWIYRIAMNESLRAAAKGSKIQWGGNDMLDNVPSAEPHMLQGLIDKEKQGMLNAFIAELQPDYKSALMMHYYAGMSGDEIAEALNIPIGTVNSRIARGRDTLREKLTRALKKCM
ncbi:MAG: sigma-70 family RNA polymerase sigma factor [Fibrobacterota bacterium]